MHTHPAYCIPSMHARRKVRSRLELASEPRRSPKRAGLAAAPHASGNWTSKQPSVGASSPVGADSQDPPPLMPLSSPLASANHDTDQAHVAVCVRTKTLVVKRPVHEPQALSATEPLRPRIVPANTCWPAARELVHTKVRGSSKKRAPGQADSPQSAFPVAFAGIFWPTLGSRYVLAVSCYRGQDSSHEVAPDTGSIHVARPLGIVLRKHLAQRGGLARRRHDGRLRPVGRVELELD